MNLSLSVSSPSLWCATKLTCKKDQMSLAFDYLRTKPYMKRCVNATKP